jgi:hypothetical protein
MLKTGVPFMWEYFPVNTVARLGVQIELHTNALLKRMPSLPSLSRFGVKLTFDP